MHDYSSKLHGRVNAASGFNATLALNHVCAFQYSLLFPADTDSNKAGSHHKEEIQVPTPILPRVGISILYKSAARLTVRREIYKAGNVCLYQMIFFKRLKGLFTCVSKILCFKL